MFNKPWYNSEQIKKYKLGKFYKATMKQQPVLCRVIEFERITNYVLEDYYCELGRLNAIKFKPFLVPTLGYFI